MGRESKPADVITREYTINLGKAITGVTFKKRAPRAVAAVRARSRARDETLEWMRDATREMRKVLMIVVKRYYSSSQLSFKCNLMWWVRE